LSGAVQILGVYKHVPVKGLQEAVEQGFGAVQTTGVLLHIPLEQESTVQLFLSSQLTVVYRHPLTESQPVKGLQRLEVVQLVSTEVQTPLEQDLCTHASEAKLHLGV
jgi:hypothetical protein